MRSMPRTWPSRSRKIRIGDSRSVDIGPPTCGPRGARAHLARSAATRTPASIAPPRARRTRGGLTGRALGRRRPDAGARVRLPFFRVISFSTSISRSRSATIFFSRPFPARAAGGASRRSARGCRNAPPRVDRLRTDAMFLGDLRHRPLIGLAEDCDHLLFAESRLLHGSLVSPRAPILSAFNWSEKRQADQVRAGRIRRQRQVPIDAVFVT
jgi:hypothetical protein